MNTTTALLVIDMQVGLVGGPAFQPNEVLARIQTLIERARACAAPVVFIQDKDVGDGVGSPGWQLHPALAPAPQDLRVFKAWADSFFETDLHEQLQARGVTRVIVTGMKTEVCVDMTSRRAVALGYDVTLVADAHTTTPNRVLSAEQTVRYHNDLLWEFGQGDGFGANRHWITVLPTRELLEQPEELRHA